MSPRLEGVVAWPAERARRYRDLGLWAGSTIGAEIDRWAELHGHRIAVTAGEEDVTYAQLAARSRAVAAQLHARGIRRDDRVVMQLGNTLAFCDLLLGLLRIGAPPVMALPAHREHEIGYLVDHAQAVGLAVPDDDEHQAMAAHLRATRPELLDVRADLAGGEPPPADGPESEDIALFLLSGGTTGLPKLIPRSHDDYLFNARRSAEVCGIGPHTVYLAVLPISHNFPLACPGLLGTWLQGGRVVLAPDTRPATAFDLIERERVTACALVPALAIRWLEERADSTIDLSSLALLQVGGARLVPEIARRIEPALGCRLQQVFGMAEGLLNYTRADDPEQVVIGTQGRPMCDEDEVRVVDENGDDVAPGEEGELLTRGPYTLCGYYRADEHNARAFTPDGFYRTGDIVLRDARGNFVVQGRSKDMINRGGEKISAEEIEDLVLAHPAIRAAAAVAMPDPVLGERTCLYAVPIADAALTLADLTAFLGERRIAKFKLPERLELVAALPVTKIGKVDKKALRDDVAAKLRAETTVVS